MIYVMAKTAKGLNARSYKSVGKTHDGITILKPKTKPTHFTTREIRTAIAQVMRDSSSDKIVAPAPGEAQPRGKTPHPAKA